MSSQAAENAFGPGQKISLLIVYAQRHSLNMHAQGASGLNFGLSLPPLQYLVYAYKNALCDKYLTLKVPIATKVVCFSCLLKC